MASLADIFSNVDIFVDEQDRFTAKADRVEYRGYFAEGATLDLARKWTREATAAAEEGREPLQPSEADRTAVIEAIVLAALGRESGAVVESLRRIDPEA